jgi:GWxTD domain-containing protein
MRSKIFIVVWCICFILPVNAQQKPEQKYREWIDKYVVWIISPEEKEAFQKLENDSDFDRFIENFWQRRDPNPDTEVNEFKIEHERRFYFANEHFTSGRPGWMTDRGRIYILFGQPLHLQKGFSTFENIFNVPFETWFYKDLGEFGSNVELTFIDPIGTGEFKITDKAKRERFFKAVDKYLNFTNGTSGMMCPANSSTERKKFWEN